MDFSEGLGSAVLLFPVLEVVTSVLAYKILRMIKKKLDRTQEDYTMKPLPPLPASNNTAG